MAKPIMIQGTMSNAGKSIVVGGLCRVFQQDGKRVAPFKSQNMALNSFITRDGLEMGRAQVMQAEAARIEPLVQMNPILLKPTNDMGSQVIVNGEVVGVMSAMEYFEHKRDYIPDIMKAYQYLDDRYDIIVIEGAGSPAEINLKAEDIVNMGMAKMVNAPVLLVGDIDRGGVFAQIVGTIMLLEQEEQHMIKGIVINKFRGDKEILMPGLDMLEEKIHKKVQGVIPYFYLDIDDEDSLTERFTKSTRGGLLDVVVIQFPRISNFTDINPFAYREEINLRYITKAADFGNPDMVILPGTKNTMEDLKWLRQTGLEHKILQHAEHEKLIFGICGGYQMLGNMISDPHGIEGSGSIKGLGLLQMQTIFQPEKTRTRVTGMFQSIEGILKELSGVRLEGYEIHMGISNRNEGAKSLTKLDSGDVDGTFSRNVYGTYVHGIFDEEQVVKGIVRALLQGKGYDVSSVESFDLLAYKEEQYNQLADIIRDNMDMEAIYAIIEKGI